MMYVKLTARGVEMAAEKAAKKRERGRGSGPSHPLNKVGLEKSRLVGRLEGREAANKDNDIIEDLEYCKNGGSSKARKDPTFTLRAQTQIRHFGQLFLYPHI